jgi:hypothetical protein
VIGELQSRTDGNDRPPIEPTPRDKAIPMSYAQERSWRFSQTPEGAAGYTDATTTRIRGHLDIGVFHRAVDQIFRRHEMLRTTFAEHDGRPVQIIHPPTHAELSFVDVSAAADPEGNAAATLTETASQPFDLARGPLVRLAIVKVGPVEHQLQWVDHHIISDGWSLGLFFDELGAIYEAFRRGEPSPLPDEIPLQHADFAVWERRTLRPSNRHFQADLEWWAETLHNAPPPLVLPFRRTEPEPTAAAEEGAIWWGMMPDVSRALDQQGRDANATWFMVRLAVLAAQLALETDSDDLLLATYTGGRSVAATRAMFGCFSNVVPLRLRISPMLSFSEILTRVRTCVIAMKPHGDFPFELLSSGLAARGIEPPELRLIFNPGTRVHRDFADLEITPLKRTYPAMPWGFTFSPSRPREATNCNVAFDARIHDPAGVRQFIERFQALAVEVAAEPGRVLDTLPGVQTEPIPTD